MTLEAIGMLVTCAAVLLAGVANTLLLIAMHKEKKRRDR